MLQARTENCQENCRFCFETVQARDQVEITSELEKKYLKLISKPHLKTTYLHSFCCKKCAENVETINARIDEYSRCNEIMEAHALTANNVLPPVDNTEPVLQPKPLPNPKAVPKATPKPNKDNNRVHRQHHANGEPPIVDEEVPCADENQSRDSEESSIIESEIMEGNIPYSQRHSANFTYYYI